MQTGWLVGMSGYKVHRRGLPCITRRPNLPQSVNNIRYQESEMPTLFWIGPFVPELTLWGARLSVQLGTELIRSCFVSFIACLVIP